MLRITEIFYSLQGESTLVGLPTVFIRLTGCPLRCQYCDTEYAFAGGSKKSIAEIMQVAASYQANYITVTGGEPLAQKDCILLLCELAKHYTVSLETSGALPVVNVPKSIIKVMDIKTPDSGEESKNYLANLDYITQKDQLKFVICSKDDYEWSKEFIFRHRLIEQTTVLFSPSYQQIEAKELAQWILSDQLNVRLQIQLHKFLWGEQSGV